MFHFHRTFKAAVGETVVEFIRRLRLDKGANYLLSRRTIDVTTIGPGNWVFYVAYVRKQGQYGPLKPVDKLSLSLVNGRGQEGILTQGQYLVFIGIILK